MWNQTKTKQSQNKVAGGGGTSRMGRQRRAPVGRKAARQNMRGVNFIVGMHGACRRQAGDRTGCWRVAVDWTMEESLRRIKKEMEGKELEM